MSNAKKSFELYKELIELTQKSNTSKIAMGDHLLMLKESGRYQDIAGKDESWATFLAMPEIKIPYSTAARYMKIAEVYIHKIGLKYEDLYGYDTWSLDRVAGQVNKANVKKWLEDIKALSRADIQILVKHGDVDQMKCDHDFKQMPPKFKCGKCGVITNHNED